MLLLLFNTHKEQYAINCVHIVEVIPHLLLQPIPMTPLYVAGAVNYRGTALPVIDISQLIDGSPCTNLISTRIILIDIDFGLSGEKKTIGLLAEKVTQTVKTPKGWSPLQKKDGSLFIDSSAIGHEMVQWFEPSKMLPANLPQSLFMDSTQREDTL
nr:chemotaxis protein CheW [Desulfobulbaceae bacterium]